MILWFAVGFIVLSGIFFISTCHYYDVLKAHKKAIKGLLDYVAYINNVDHIDAWTCPYHRKLAELTEYHWNKRQEQSRYEKSLDKS